VPTLQLRPQRTPSQVGAPFGSPGQGAHAEPQLEVEVLETQAPPQRWVSTRHSQVWLATLQASLAAHWSSNAQPGMQVPLPRSQ
jgi:hypothetical protein